MNILAVGAGGFVGAVLRYLIGKIPVSENMFILSRILGKRVDGFLVPLATEQPMFEVEIEAGQDPASMLRRLKEYAIRLGALFLNHSLNDSTA